MEIKLIADNTILREVRYTDASFIANLRSIPALNEYLSSSAPITLQQQEKWLLQYFQSKDGFYFIIENPLLKKSVGTISIYDINEDKREAQFGRYICTNPLNSIESEYMILRFCFDIMQLNSIYCKTAEKNEKVWRQHILFGFKDVGSEFYKSKGLFLKLQSITRSEFSDFDYSKIISILNKFKK